MSVFTVWVQPIDDYTTPENIDKYGSVHDVLSEYENDEGGTPNKQFCDGQTSKTPPRYAQDRMIGIYTRSDEAAQIISNSLRNDVRSRIMSGQLRVPLPIWYVPQTGIAGAVLAADLSLLRARALHEFPTYPDEQIFSVLDEVIDAGIDNSTTGNILNKVRRRLTT